MGRFSWIITLSTGSVEGKEEGGRRVRDEDAMPEAEVRVMRLTALKMEGFWVPWTEAPERIGGSKPDATENPR